MRTLLSIYEPEGNFWELNKSFKTLTLFKDLYKKDRSTKKNKSSKVMWIISGLVDEQSPYHDMPDDVEDKHGKYKTIGGDLMNSVEWWEDNSEKYEDIFNEYNRIFLTPARRALRAWEKKLLERQKVFDETEYMIGLTNEDGKLVGSNVEVLDKMFERSSKIWDQFFKIKEQLEGEKDVTGKGGSIESGSDIGAI